MLVVVLSLLEEFCLQYCGNKTKGECMNKIITLLSTLLLTFQAQATVLLNNEVSFSPIPEKPIVIDASIVAEIPNGNKVNIYGAWTKFRFQMTNTTARPLYVISLNLKELSGNRELLVDPSYLGEEHLFLMMLEPGESKVFNYDIYFGSLNHERYNKTIGVEAKGWFGTYENPVKRFSGQYIFYTQ